MPWTDAWGNHRAVIDVKKAADAVFVEIDWRRRDHDAASKRLMIMDAAGKQVDNILRLTIDREKASFVFQPVSGAGIYYVYYMPWQGKKNIGQFTGDYLLPEPAPQKQWLVKNRLSVTNPPAQKAVLLALESRTAFDSFYPMEVVAKKKEVAALLQKQTTPFLLFPENRRYPIRMQDDLPYRWLQKTSSLFFSDTAMNNEYYVFQVGFFAATQDIREIKISYKNNIYPVTCFNLEGVDANGLAFTKKVGLKKGHVQALWIGVDIPADAKPGPCRFALQVDADDLPAQIVDIQLDILPRTIDDRGDSETWRHSRLRWLNSTLGIDDATVKLFAPLKQYHRSITSSMSAITLQENGLPQSLQAKGNELLQEPILFDILTSRGPVVFRNKEFRFTKTSGGQVAWEAISENDEFRLHCNASMEFDGYIRYRLGLTSIHGTPINDIRLSIPVKNTTAEYFMGMGLPGGACPARYAWKWQGPQDSYWIGNTKGGLFCEMRGASYTGPLLNLYHPEPPPSWYNENRGGFQLSSGAGLVYADTYTGARQIAAGDSLQFEFALLVTPVKQLNTSDQFTNRYYHNGSKPAPSPADVRSGIKVTNVHHANAVNPYINYPFLSIDSIRRFVRDWHQQGVKVKLYYTIRELTNNATELWALRSLGNEILAGGTGGGYVWLREHLVSDYDPQWFTPITGNEANDAAILTSGRSRWYNYYIEGLRWLVQNGDIDGLYLDDVAFERDMLKRMRKVMDDVKPGCLMDLHSNTGFSKGPVTQYMEFFPYIDKLWFGESFRYDEMAADNWLVEVSGIPFGLMGDMLHAGGNPWRGMVYGMTVRYPWFTEGVNCDPRAIWQVWDTFNIGDAEMRGYWDDSVIVTTSNPAVLATTYSKKDEMMIAVASWAKDTVQVKLQFDWAKAGWTADGSSGVLSAPGIENYQPASSFTLDDSIPVGPARGWLFRLKRKL